MSVGTRIAGAWRALTGPDQSKRLADTEPVSRNGNLARAVRGFPRDRPIGYSTAPTPARQQWEQHRIREESRQQSLVSPHFRAFLEWAKCFVLGEELFGLKFSIPAPERERLRDATLWLRDEWRRYQEMPIGARDETLAELCGESLDTMLIDGDCFIVPYMNGTADWHYQYYPGDALAETGHTPGAIGRGTEPQRTLGITFSPRGRAITYHFRQNSRYRSPGYISYGAGSVEFDMAADRVWHIRDRRRDGAAPRGWPRITNAYQDMARLDEFYAAFIRSAIRRAAAAIALKRDNAMTAGDFDRDDDEPEVRDPLDFRIENTGEFTDESVKPYQESEASAGNLLELEPGYDPVNIDTGAPSAQEAMLVERMEHRICKGLGVSLMALTGDLKGISFSSGQIGRIGDAATAYDLQGIVRRQLIRPVYRLWLMTVWITLLNKFPMVRPDDLMLFEHARHSLPRYPVLEKGKLLAGVGKAFQDGILDYAEARAEAGQSTDDIEAVIAGWKDQRAAMGLTGASDGDEPSGDASNGGASGGDVEDDGDEEGDDDD